jgi:hypothetical protein
MICRPTRDLRRRKSLGASLQPPQKLAPRLTQHGKSKGPALSPPLHGRGGSVLSAGRSRPCEGWGWMHRAPRARIDGNARRSSSGPCMPRPRRRCSCPWSWRANANVMPKETNGVPSRGHCGFVAVFAGRARRADAVLRRRFAARSRLGAVPLPHRLCRRAARSEEAKSSARSRKELTRRGSRQCDRRAYVVVVLALIGTPRSPPCEAAHQLHRVMPPGHQAC